MCVQLGLSSRWCHIGAVGQFVPEEQRNILIVLCSPL